ncbi:MAG: hypothetical protein WC757_04075 [Candidatus Paceibacterota bacterium]|jgi:hypothetical protein
MESEKKSFGSVAAIIIILILLVLGAVYFLSTGALTQKGKGIVQEQTAPIVIDETVKAFKTQSSSDEIDAIKADLDATDASAIDADLQSDAALKI